MAEQLLGSASAAAEEQGSEFDNLIWAEVCDGLVGVAALVAEDAAGADPIVHAMVGVAVNPKVNGVGLDDILHVFGEGGGDGIVAEIGLDGTKAWGVVGHHDGLALEWLRQSFLQPFSALPVEQGGVQRCQAPEFGADAD